MTTQQETCHACDQPYTSPSAVEAESFDICPACRVSKPIFAVVLDADPEFTVYGSGTAHTALRIREEGYWQYTEFSDKEWSALHAHHDYGADLSAISRKDEEVPAAELTAAVASYVKGLQALWEYGVPAGILATNVQHQPGGELFRQWPQTFLIEVFPRSLDDLKECGVVAA